MDSLPHKIEILRLSENRRVIRVSEQASGLCLEKVLGPSEPVAVQKKILERALVHLLKNKELLAA